MMSIKSTLKRRHSIWRVSTYGHERRLTSAGNVPAHRLHLDKISQICSSLSFVVVFFFKDTISVGYFFPSSYYQVVNWICPLTFPSDVAEDLN